MSGTLYRDLVFGIQALRRRVERDAVALGGALGAALDLMPHQIANVARVLTDLEVRHLLADEVGLGKTAQAIMILNALRIQREKLRVLILVPDALMMQWRDELRSRGHVAPVEGDEESGESEETRPRLLWPQRLKAEGLDLAAFDMLIVDEPQQLTETLQRQIAAVARNMSAVLILTATPPFRRPADMSRLLRMIEPSRILGDEEDPLAALRERERAAADALRSGVWGEGLGGAPPADTAAASASAAHSAARRIIRTRRAQWARSLPRREPRVWSAEPTASERERQRLMWSYFGYLGDLARDFELDLLAQRVPRSPASLRQRVTYLKGHGHERGGLLAQVDGLLGSQYGDSRFDALLDILCEIWSEDPEERVLIAAGDNLTVDDLAKRLPKLFDEGPEGPLIVTTLRNQSRGAESLSDSDDIIANAVRAFQTGEARLLIAAEVGSFGLNLQHTRHIVLYSIPWDPSDVEQWIGRVDRIGNTAIKRLGDGSLTPIVVHVPAQRGLVDERVVEILRATGILERSISLDADAVQTAREAILKAALANSEAEWQSARDAAEAVGAMGELEDLGLPLLAASPWSPERAAKIGASFADAEPSGPVLGGIAKAGLEGREDALLDWLRAMRRAGEYETRKINKKLGVYSLGYPSRALKPRHLSDAARVPLDQSVIHWPRTPFAYYRLLRRHLEQPPLTHYQDKDSDPEQLFFLDHGSLLHETLMDAWMSRLLSGGRCRLRVPSHHRLADRGRCAVLVRTAVLHPDRLLPKVKAVPQHLREADLRFLRTHLPAQLLFAAAIVTPSAVELLDEESTLALIAPEPKSALLEPDRGEVWEKGSVPEAAEQRATEIAARKLAADTDAAWSHRLPEVRAAIQQRIYAIQADVADRAWLADRELGRRQGRSAEDIRAELEVRRTLAASRISALNRATEDLPRALHAGGAWWVLLDRDP